MSDTEKDQAETEELKSKLLKLKNDLEGRLESVNKALAILDAQPEFGVLYRHLDRSRIKWLL